MKVRHLSHVWAMEALLEGEAEGPAAPRSHRGASILKSSLVGQAAAGGNLAADLEAIWRVRSAIVHPKKPVGSEATHQALSDKARSYSRCMLHWFLRLYSVDGLTSGRSAWLPAHRDVLKLLGGGATATSPGQARFVAFLHARFPGFPRLDA